MQRREWVRNLFGLAVAAALPAAARAAEDELVLGVFPRRNPAETTRMFTPLAEHLGTQIGRKVKLATTRDFESFWQAVTERRYDIVHYNQYHYIRSAKSYHVIAHIEELGKSTISSVLYVRRDSGITQVGQLRGRTVLFGGGEDAMISYIANRYLMLQAGIKKDDFKPMFAVNPPNSVVALYSRQADAAGASDGVLDFPLVRKSVNVDELAAIATSEPLLQLPIAVKSTMPAKLRMTIQSTLVQLRDTEAGKQALASAVMTGIGKAEDKDYEPHRRIVRAVMGAAEAAPR